MKIFKRLSFFGLFIAILLCSNGLQTVAATVDYINNVPAVAGKYPFGTTIGTGNWDTLYTYTAPADSYIKTISVPIYSPTIQNYGVYFRILGNGNTEVKKININLNSGTVTLFGTGNYSKIDIQIMGNNGASVSAGGIKEGGTLICYSNFTQSVSLSATDIDKIAQAVVDKQIIKDINTNTSDANKILNGTTYLGKSLVSIYDAVNETREFARKRAIKVIDGVSFKEIVYGTLSGTPTDGVTGTAATGITVAANSTLGYTEVGGTLGGVGTKVVLFGSRGVIFNVVAKPEISNIATVSFQ